MMSPLSAFCSSCAMDTVFPGEASMSLVSEYISLKSSPYNCSSRDMICQ